MLNGLPWDLVYREWWGEYPPHDRTEYVGLYRDVAYRWHLVKLSLHLELTGSTVSVWRVTSHTGTIVVRSQIVDK